VLYQQNGAFYTMLSNTPVLSEGTFTFYNLSAGIYLVKALITDASVNPGLMHTYYESVASVNAATPVTLTAKGTKTIYINMVPIPVPPGDYKISGKVIERTGIPGTTPPSGSGTPKAGIDIVLRQNGTVVANFVTGSDGKYSFTNLPAGDYDVWLELFGFTYSLDAKLKLPVKVTVDAAHPLKDKVDFTIWTNMLTGIDDMSDGLDMKLYPNPTTGITVLELGRIQAFDTFLMVYDISGRVLLHEQIRESRTLIDMNQFSKGIYMVKVVSDQSSVTQKVILR
jgi:hypothetical protein